MREQDPQWQAFRFFVRDPEGSDAQVGWLEVGIARRGTPQYETNKHMAWIELEVLTPYRRQGIGTVLLGKVAALMHQHDRSLVLTHTDEDDGKAFIRAVGAQVGLRMRQARLDLDRVDWPMVNTWAEEGPRRSPHTTLAFVVNRLDEAILEEFAQVLSEVGNQSPRGDLEVGDWVATPESIRERERTMLDAGGTILRGLTREADGAISGLTEMGYFPDEKTMIHQWFTGVKEEYRGRGLGKWLKAAMLLRVEAEFPEVRFVSTGNATSNAAMRTINERLGFRLHRKGVMAQMSYDALEQFLHGARRPS